ncbi:nad-dependent dehydratase : GDP-L-fucose synthase OS=Brevibacillus brevis (strain 47 / JCM 6285 / NBRC 100599) GN=fcl PE=3 SV=1: Epimerase [Gemmataceae bacterium]|nr:nad-dependent dehydratase : GDP-L-fucose synthase OS=Brevibacillus brevis (strain 47 / JCM 6285 / NBRC 100599) GN=fcl PE=3 SV=1: Epimerase [Gemmataceae bacterium]VTU00908.1 nad-dependent dehydratase : GDP-L-fucose synthase OS=Brevibacillus brevis (strain 47 / JCM 6285 / NBRC 100599) GN=fcl PE=3 SV=1: Epimerase [Gemmataceae bacterium]
MSPLSGKRILVTGGGGFLGGHVLAELRRAGCQGVGAPRQSEYDLTLQHEVRRLLADSRPDVVIHLAAAVGGIGANQANPGAFLYRNLIMGTELIEASMRAGVEKLVLTGTTCSYPRSAPLPLREDDLWSGFPEPATAPYGLAKRVLMAQAAAYREQYGFRTASLLLTNLYGTGDSFHPQNAHVVPAMIRKFAEAKAAHRPCVTLWGTGRATRDFLYASDAARAVRLAAESLDTPDPVNVGTGVETSTAALAHAIAERVGYPGEVRFDTDRPDGHPRRYLDTARCTELLGFEPRVALPDGLDRTITWYLSRAYGRHAARAAA